MIRILLAPGHGPGKAHNRGGLCYNEGDNNYYYSLVLKEELERNAEFKVDLVRKNINDNPNLATRSAMGQGYDIYIGIHSNAAGKGGATIRGTEVWDSVEKPNKILAKLICDASATLFNNNNRGVRYKEGQPGYNWYGELRFNKARSAMIVEHGFHTNILDCQFFKNNHKLIAETQVAAIASYYKIKNKTTIGINILSSSKATVQQMQEWAKRKGANRLLIDLAPLFYDISIKAGVNPLIAYCQAAKETGYMKFGGVLNASFNNPCGLKTKDGGGDKDPNAHQRFKNWEEGIQAQVDHLALYAGANGYPKPGTPDPRHFQYLKGTASTVEGLGGKWAPGLSYGTDIIKMIKEVEATVVLVNPNQSIIKVDLLGTRLIIKGILKDGTNYVKVDGKEISLRNIFESMGFEVAWNNVTRMVIIRWKI